eukprot:g2667.t1
MKEYTRILKELNRLITRDEGKRNIGALAKACEGNLRAAAEALVSKPKGKVLILCGFPALLDEPVKQESDGPSGTLCVAKSLSSLGYCVDILTDDCNVDVFDACFRVSSVSKQDSSTSGNNDSGLVRLLSLPAQQHYGDDVWNDRVLPDYVHGVSAVVALERTGPTKDGNYCTMGGKSMNQWVAPLDRIFRMCNDANIVTVAVGDGGNELGMGGYRDIIERTIPKGSEVCCDIFADILVPCSVSNWGGYGLGAAILLAHSHAAVDRTHALSILSAFPTAEEESALMDAGINAGMRDGATGLLEKTVDGLPWAESVRVLEAARSLLGEWERGGYEGRECRAPGI